MAVEVALAVVDVAGTAVMAAIVKVSVSCLVASLSVVGICSCSLFEVAGAV